MIYTFILAVILTADPYPVFAFVSDHDTMEECQKAIEKTLEKDTQKNAGCMVIIKPENFEKSKGT